MKSSRVCWRPGPSGFSRNKYTRRKHLTRARAESMASASHAWPAPLASRRCKLFVHELHQPVAAHKMPEGWPHHQYAFEWHLNAAALRSPWRVSARTGADVVFAAGNLSLLCAAGKTFSRRRIWYGMLNDSTLWHGNAHAARWSDGSVLVAMQKSDCGAPWTDYYNSFRPLNSLLLEEAQQGYGGGAGSKLLTDTIISPFVVSRPLWLVGADSAIPPSAQPPMAWSARKLLFFAGHVPKLFIADLRYLLWKQTRRHPGVTTRSWTIMCTVGSYEKCLRTDDELRELAKTMTINPDFVPHKRFNIRRRELNTSVLQLQAYLATHCHEHCPKNNACDGSLSIYFDPRAALPTFRQRCSKYYLRLVDYRNEFSDMLQEHRIASSKKSVANHGQSEESYLSDAMKHRFCLIAPGDTWSTKKISEGVAIGAARGCIPVIITPTLRRSNERNLGHRLARYLPYTTWLDWCSIAYFVTEQTARSSMAAVLERLAAVSEAEAQAKHAALLRVRDAFVVRAGDPGPTAPDYVLGEACEAARRSAALDRAVPTVVVGGEHARCHLG